MHICLYQQSKSEAFRLSEKALLKLGFILSSSDDITGLISGRKQMKRNGPTTFLDIKITRTIHSINVSVISNVFTAEGGTFIADGVTAELFIETLHDLLRIQPPDNPFRLSQIDYALAVGF